jgi:hypothetical protein
MDNCYILGLDILSIVGVASNKNEFHINQPQQMPLIKLACELLVQHARNNCT